MRNYSIVHKIKQSSFFLFNCILMFNLFFQPVLVYAQNNNHCLAPRSSLKIILHNKNLQNIALAEFRETVLNKKPVLKARADDVVETAVIPVFDQDQYSYDKENIPHVVFIISGYGEGKKLNVFEVSQKNRSLVVNAIIENIEFNNKSLDKNDLLEVLSTHFKDSSSIIQSINENLISSKRLEDNAGSSVAKILKRRALNYIGYIILSSLIFLAPVNASISSAGMSHSRVQTITNNLLYSDHNIRTQTLIFLNNHYHKKHDPVVLKILRDNAGAVSSILSTMPANKGQAIRQNFRNWKIVLPKQKVTRQKVSRQKVTRQKSYQRQKVTAKTTPAFSQKGVPSHNEYLGMINFAINQYQSLHGNITSHDLRVIKQGLKSARIVKNDKSVNADDTYSANSGLFKRYAQLTSSSQDQNHLTTATLIHETNHRYLRARQVGYTYMSEKAFHELSGDLFALAYLQKNAPHLIPVYKRVWKYDKSYQTFLSTGSKIRRRDGYSQHQNARGLLSHVFNSYGRQPNYNQWAVAAIDSYYNFVRNNSLDQWLSAFATSLKRGVRSPRSIPIVTGLVYQDSKQSINIPSANQLRMILVGGLSSFLTMLLFNFLNGVSFLSRFLKRKADGVSKEEAALLIPLAGSKLSFEIYSQLLREKLNDISLNERVKARNQYLELYVASVLRDLQGELITISEAIDIVEKNIRGCDGLKTLYNVQQNNMVLIKTAQNNDWSQSQVLKLVNIAA